MKKFILAFIGVFLILSSTIPIKAEELNEKIILIDPGHGGIDGGAISKNGTVEKDINLDIALKLRESLEDKGYKVFMTRECDKGLYEKGKSIKEKKREDLKKRASLKVETNCDIFISIHENMFPQAKCFGAQVWYASNTDSEKLANIVQDSIKVVVNDGNKRVAKPAGEAYLILRDKYEGASILVECGFLSNSDEESRLKTDEHQQLLVDGIVKGIDEYFSNDSSTNEKSEAS
ncbi:MULTISPECIES: N-acetylmuramoyl-L-alanine amidase CwlD [Clostridia]|uniref:N-acetylmuramoyl-L-alanine amidase CwlD n=2 Tax=Clostridia TaxID=186801 RepID=A0A8I0AEJ2_9CLOT|nr:MULTISPECIES: N-acetylmuramoyl-L-alanine amidase CwlD [Clostridia]MBC5640672.1 N-acetylmuramoyl-L-alanine amidase CwlD [Clostridium lentum]MBC5654748.1 N-acetylmuramoyl-L-alanine amidase CwlD [Blautia lenta]